jgi:hypothetical protein
MPQFTLKHIEEWDFRHVSHDDPEYDVEADLFLGRNFTRVQAVELARLVIIKGLLEHGLATATEDGQNVRFTSKPHEALWFLNGWKKENSRFTRGGRFERRVVGSLQREYRAHGQLKLSLFPTRAGT